MSRTLAPALAAGTAAFAAACAPVLADAEAETGAYELLACRFEAPAVCLVVNEYGAGHMGDEACDAGGAPMTVTYMPLAMHSGLAELDVDGAREVVDAGDPDADLYFTWRGGAYVMERPSLEAGAAAETVLLARREGEATLIDARRGLCREDAVSADDIETRFGVAP